MIISSKILTILIIRKENITINRQNQLIVHPYLGPLFFCSGDGTFPFSFITDLLA